MLTRRIFFFKWEILDHDHNYKKRVNRENDVQNAVGKTRSSIKRPLCGRRWDIFGRKLLALGEITQSRSANIY